MRLLLLICTQMILSTITAQGYFQAENFEPFFYSCDVYDEHGQLSVKYVSERDHLRIYEEHFDMGVTKHLRFYDQNRRLTDTYVLKYTAKGLMQVEHSGENFVAWTPLNR